MGEEAEVVLDSTNISVDDKKVYATVLQKFNEFFQVRRNVIYERARFNRRSQMEGETTEQFIMELYRFADNCNYQDFRDEMIRDRFIVGIRDQRLSERMQLDATLDLEKAKKMSASRRL